MGKKDYYEILGVTRNASQDDIKKAYRKLVVKYHPDKTGGNPDLEEKFREVSEAYDTLSDENKKRNYDNPRNQSNFGDFFNWGNPFSNPWDSHYNDPAGGNNGWRNSFQNKGKNISVELQLTLEEIAKGVSKKVKIWRRNQCGDCSGTGSADGKLESCPDCKGTGQIYQNIRTNFGVIQNATLCHSCGGLGSRAKDPCKSCHGEGTKRDIEEIEISIPKGALPGHSFIVSGKGDQAKAPSDPGDLVVGIKEIPHPVYKREGLNLICERNISFSEACLGTDISVPSLSGSEYKIKIPPGSQPGRIFRMSGKGIPEFNGFFTGDILVKMNIKIPENLSDDQKKIIIELSQILD
jgi:molecular chaperone DnaJ